jgi:hypothetical protein
MGDWSLSEQGLFPDLPWYPPCVSRVCLLVGPAVVATAITGGPVRTLQSGSVARVLPCCSGVLGSPCGASRDSYPFGLNNRPVVRPISRICSDRPEEGLSTLQSFDASGLLVAGRLTSRGPSDSHHYEACQAPCISPIWAILA